MKILFLTSSMTDADFASYAKTANIKPNPSNQNFYNKLIRCLSLNNTVYALSLRPFCKGMFKDDFLYEKTSQEGMVTYYYPNQSVKFLDKLKKEAITIGNLIDKIVIEQSLDNFVIMVDTLRINLIKAALQAKIKYPGVKIVGVVTDNPSNLTNVDTRYAAKVIKEANKLDAYICLTERLNTIFNKNGRPNYIFEGLVDDIEENKPLPIGKYIFFGGALYERYGVKRLINAFRKVNTDVNLVIAGSGDLRKFIYEAAERDKRILYLSQVEKKMVYNLEQNAIFNINPRPFDITLDYESVPSKLLEYIASGTPTISTIHSTLKSYFSDDIIWLEDSSEASLTEAIQTYLDLPNHSIDQKRAGSARVKVYEMYGLKNQSKNLTLFIESIKTSEMS